MHGAVKHRINDDCDVALCACSQTHGYILTHLLIPCQRIIVENEAVEVKSDSSVDSFTDLNSFFFFYFHQKKVRAHTH